MYFTVDHLFNRKPVQLLKNSMEIRLVGIKQSVCRNLRRNRRTYILQRVSKLFTTVDTEQLRMRYCLFARHREMESNVFIRNINFGHPGNRLAKTPGSIWSRCATTAPESIYSRNDVALNLDPRPP